MKKLIIVTTHPIQYNAPLFRLLAERHVVQVKVLYTWGEKAMAGKFDPGFGKNIDWDIPLLEGYEFEFLKNVSKTPGSHHNKGIINPHIIDKIEEFGPDAVLVYGWNFDSHLRVMKHFKSRIPIYFRGDSTLLNQNSHSFIRKFLRFVYLTNVYRYVDRAFYVGTNNRSYFVKYGLKERQLVFVPHAIDNLRFSRNREANEQAAFEWRKRLGITENAVVFLFAGKLEPNKNPFILCEAFCELTGTNSHLILVGNGIHEGELRAIYSNRTNIHFIPFQNQSLMPIVYRLGDWFVLPSRSETWGLSINEAMASGRTVIASDKCGGAVDLIDDQVSGLIFQWNDKSSLVTAMNTAISSRSKWRSMRTLAAQKIAQFSFESDALAIEACLISNTNHEN
ncbi:MAG: glycosyltransferase family 4 protein [Agriterribacter sp.]